MLLSEWEVPVTLRGAVARVVAPTTDLGVAIQVVVVLSVLGLLAWATRRRREWWYVLGGVALLFLGAAGLRAAH